jgi:DNA repair photolyase
MSAPVGRGTPENPPNRFVPLHVELDPEPDAEGSDGTEAHAAQRTQFFRDTSRSILSHNDSPDVGFEVSVNPYRGCEHGCSYCMAGDTPVLLADGTTRALGDLRVGDEVYGTERRGWHRRHVRTRVLAHWASRKPALQVRLANGCELTASAEHRLLTRRGWKHVARSEASGGASCAHLTLNDRLLGVGALAAPKGSADLRVVGVEALGRTIDMFDITTGTGDFIANGVVSHNCYARPYHEYLGFSSGLDFETKILVKEDAPELLREALASPRWTPTPVAMSGVTDCYQPVERRLRITRRCLEVFDEFKNPVGVVTKNALVARDADVLARLAEDDAALVHLSITSLDRDVQRRMEPRTSTPAQRLDAVRALAAAGVPVGVLVAPVVPGLTDSEIPAILVAAAEAGARSAGYTVLRLPWAVKDLFAAWLDRHFPDRKEKVLARVRDLHGGALADPRFGRRMRGEGVFADAIAALFDTTCRRLGLTARHRLSVASFRRRGAEGGQLALFDGA